MIVLLLSVCFLLLLSSRGCDSLDAALSSSWWLLPKQKPSSSASAALLWVNNRRRRILRHVDVPVPLLIHFRGGDDDNASSSNEEEDRELDAYIEQLVASVDTSEVEEEEHDDTTTTTATAETPRPELTQDEEESVEEEEEEEEVEDDSSELKVSDTIQQGPAVSCVAEEEQDEEQEEPEREEPEQEVPAAVSAKPKRKRKKRRTAISAQGDSVETITATAAAKKDKEDVDETDAASTTTKTQTETPPPTAVVYRRPNAIYRFLLGKGRIGHFVVMICVLVAELFQMYIPILMNVLIWILTKLGLSGGGGVSRYYDDRDRSQRRDGSGKMVNPQYAAFVSTDGSTVRGKKQKAQTKKMDQAALEQLRRVGSVREAKYRHVSLDFMQRHGIGPYRSSADKDDSAVVDMYTSKSEEAILAKTAEAEESDVDWVVQALTEEEGNQKEVSSSNVDVTPSISVGVGSGGPSLSLGVEFGIGDRGSRKKSKKSKRRKQSVLEAIAETKEPKKRASLPRASDQEGGSGIMGRLRGMTANSLMSRSLLGAYPGDAVPPDEAGSAEGVVGLARKYGYGDWSDDEEEDEAPVKRSRRRVLKTRKTKKRKKRNSGGKSSVSMGFDFTVGSSNERTPMEHRSTRTRVSRRHAESDTSTKKRQKSSRKTSASELLTDTSHIERQKKLISEKRVRLPTQRLNEKDIKSRLPKREEEEYSDS